MLDVLGLTPADQHLYEQLVMGPPLTSAELAAPGAPAGQVEPALERLRELGLITALGTQPVKWCANPPGPALDVLIADRARALAEAAGRVAELDAQFQLGAGHISTPGPAEVIYGRDAIFAIFDQLQRSARHEIRSCDAPPYPEANPAVVNTLELDHLRQGVRYRVLYDRRALDVTGRLADIEAGIAAGEQARVTDVPLKMTMADSSMAILPLHNPAAVESRLVVYDPLLLEALGLLFELYWQTALPLHVRHGEPLLSDAGGGPSPSEAHLLPLLMAGLTDHEIGAQLNLSARTVRHRVQQMMIRLDAINRFQAGYQAVARGWLGADDLPLSEPA